MKRLLVIYFVRINIFISILLLISIMFNHVKVVYKVVDNTFNIYSNYSWMEMYQTICNTLIWLSRNNQNARKLIGEYNLLTSVHSRNREKVLATWVWLLRFTFIYTLFYKIWYIVFPLLILNQITYFSFWDSIRSWIFDYL